MHHVLMAEFEDRESAEHALAELEQTQHGPESSVGMIASARLLEEAEDMPVDHTRARRGLYLGVLLGAALGLVTGALFARTVALAAPMLVLVVAGGVLGAFFAGLAGMLIGTNTPRRSIETEAGRLRRGHVMLTITTHDETSEAEAERIARSHGALTVQRA